MEIEFIELPSCYGEFVCMDDCIVSCKYWEDCMERSNQSEQDEDDDIYLI